MHTQLYFLCITILWIFSTNTQVTIHRHSEKKIVFRSNSGIIPSQQFSHYYKIMGMIFCASSVYCGQRSLHSYYELQKSFEFKNIAYASADWIKHSFVESYEEESKYSMQESFISMLSLGALSIIFGIAGMQLLGKNYTNQQDSRCICNRKKHKLNIESFN